MYVDRISNGKGGLAILVRHSYREGKRSLKKTIANITHFPPALVDLTERYLKGEKFIGIDEVMTNVGARAHGHVQAVLSAIKKLRIPELIDSRRFRERDLVVAMIASRVLFPKSKLATIASWELTTLPEELGIEDATENDLYAAMDWLLPRKERIESRLVGRHLKPGDTVLYDLSSSYFEGDKCPLASYGYNRDKKKGKKQVNYGMATDIEGRPVMFETFVGNTSDSTTLLPIVEKLHNKHGLTKFVQAADRRMLTDPNIEVLKSVGNVDWITVLRGDAIKTLVNQTNLQLGLFDETNLFEFVAKEDYPGERLIACRNPFLKKKLAADRESLLVKTEQLLEAIVKRVNSGRLKNSGKIGVAVGKVINKFKVGKHFTITIEEGHFAFERDEGSIGEDGMLDGIYVIRTSLEAEDLDAPSCVHTYKSLSKVEAAFEALKSMDLRIRPIYHYTENRVRTHLFLCMLAFYVEWHLRQAWAELTYVDEDKSIREDPVFPAQRSDSAKKKHSTRHNGDGLRLREFSGVIEALAALPKNTYRVSNGEHSEMFKRVAGMSNLQKRAIELVQTIKI